MTTTIDSSIPSQPAPLTQGEILVYAGNPGDGGYAGRRVLVEDVHVAGNAIYVRVEVERSVGKPDPVWSRFQPYRMSMNSIDNGTLRRPEPRS